MSVKKILLFAFFVIFWVVIEPFLHKWAILVPRMRVRILDSFCSNPQRVCSKCKFAFCCGIFALDQLRCTCHRVWPDERKLPMLVFRCLLDTCLDFYPMCPNTC